jgi:F-type H+-transporting ATPase subunit epsilon
MPLKCDIITQERLVFSEDVDMVMARGIDGEMAILPNHAPLITALEFGEVRVRRMGADEGFAVGGGVLQVAHNRVIILADSAERSDEIDVARAEEARRRAETMVAEGAPADPAALAALEAAIKRAQIRTKVGRRRGYRKPPGITGENPGG